jgi:hypothetical protein
MNVLPGLEKAWQLSRVRFRALNHPWLEQRGSPSVSAPKGAAPRRAERDFCPIRPLESRPRRRHREIFAARRVAEKDASDYVGELQHSIESSGEGN